MTLRPDELDLVRRIVLDGSAIQLEAGKEYLIESRLETLARLEGRADASELVTELRKAPAGPIAQKIIEAMTTNETSFFRDRLPFDALRDTVLPEMIRARSATRQLTIWCGAASTGQEPYSIAMTIRDHFPELSAWKLTIVATDLSTEVLDKARRGRFSQLEVNRGLPADLLVRHFERDGSRWKLRPAVLDLVEFRELNLVGPWPHFGRPDIVFMRNVMIYFDVEHKRKILAKVASTMAPDGYLFLGAGETTINIEDRFQRVEIDRAGCFQLTRSPAAAPPIGAIGAPIRQSAQPASLLARTNPGGTS